MSLDLSGIDLRKPAVLGALRDGNLELALKLSQPGGQKQIEEEARQEHLNIPTLPRDLKPNREAYRRLGFYFLGHHDGVDGIFFACRFPKGWKKRIDETNTLNTHLVDDRDRIRGCIYFKNASYQREASVYLLTRYEVNPRGGDWCIWDRQENAEKMVGEREKCEQSLHKGYPNWRDPVAYWI
jgi:hypothetical protein